MAAPVSVGELQLAWLAVQRGEFRPLPPPQPWRTGESERLILVMGCAGQVGTSTVALGLAELLAAARLVDCAPTVASGLLGVCDRELGRHETGWWQGSRASLLLQRCPLHTTAAPDACPIPPTSDFGLTVIDAGFPAATIAASPGWLADLLRDPTIPVVLVTRCTVPGMRQLAAALALVQDPDRLVRVVVIGPPRKHWPRGVQLPRGTDPSHITPLPHVPAIAVAGLGASPLPKSITAALHPLFEEGTLT